MQDLFVQSVRKFPRTVVRGLWVGISQNIERNSDLRRFWRIETGNGSALRAGFGKDYKVCRIALSFHSGDLPSCAEHVSP